ncbi:MAG TPA: hypothetical protein VFA56_10335 [Gaiellaceae bacterium]|nr:hypothetical protein [Gaiellaceae bacterium]
MLFSYDERLVDPTRPTFALWAGGKAPEGWHTKILWIIRHPDLDGRITVKGRQIGGTRAFTQRFYSVGDASPRPAEGAEYASILTIPAAGCWRLEFSAGAARGTLVVRAVAP